MLKLDENLPVDHRLSRIYRIGAGAMGLVLLAFGILGFMNEVGFFTTDGTHVAGLSSDGALSVLSVVVGALLFVGMLIGGNFASSLNMTVGVLFVLSGFVNLALLDTAANVLAFRMPNVLFSFVFGLVLMSFGMYGRVHSHLPHDNPYWRLRNPKQVEREARAAVAPPRTRQLSSDGGPRSLRPRRSAAPPPPGHRPSPGR